MTPQSADKPKPQPTTSTTPVKAKKEVKQETKREPNPEFENLGYAFAGETTIEERCTDNW